MGMNSSLRIAIADDEPMVLVTFARLLEALGHHVICTAKNGEELVRACQEQLVDIAFTDLEMPIMDGLTAAEHIAARGIPVVLISGHPDCYRVVLEREPLVSLIVKPATCESVRAAIDLAITSARK